MGSYTAFNAEQAYDDADKLRTPFQDDPLFDPDKHVDEDGDTNMEEALGDFCRELRSKYNCRAFIATDIDIPTHRQARRQNRDLETGETTVAGMDPLAQSVAFPAHSEAVLFLFTGGGLTTGVGAETGGILGEFHLRRGNAGTTHKPGQRAAIYLDEEFGNLRRNPENPARFQSSRRLDKKHYRYLLGVTTISVPCRIVTKQSSYSNSTLTFPSVDSASASSASTSSTCPSGLSESTSRSSTSVTARVTDVLVGSSGSLE